MRTEREPVPPRHTLDDDSSSDDEEYPQHNRQLDDEDELDFDDAPSSKRGKSVVTAEDIHINLSKSITERPRLLIAFGLMHLADSWFGPRQIVGECLNDHPTPISTSKPHVTSKIVYHEEQDVYTIGFLDTPPAEYWAPMALQLLQTIQPVQMVLLGAPSSVPSSTPIFMLRSSAPIPPASTTPKHEEIQSGIATLQLTESDDVPPLLPPKMVEGFEASFGSLGEIFGIPTVYFGVSLHVGENLEKAEFSRIVRGIERFLGIKVTEKEVDLVVNSWRLSYLAKAFGLYK